jgi:phage-related protein
MFSALFSFLQIILNLVFGALFESLFFVLQVLQVLVVGLLEVFSDRFFKPVLTAFFNHIVQPTVIFVTKMFEAWKDVSEPFFYAFMPCAEVVATCFQACKCYIPEKGARTGTVMEV